MRASVNNINEDIDVVEMRVSGMQLCASPLGSNMARPMLGPPWWCESLKLMDYLPNLPYGSTCEVLGLGFGTIVGLSLKKLELVALGQLGLSQGGT